MPRKTTSPVGPRLAAEVARRFSAIRQGLVPPGCCSVLDAIDRTAGVYGTAPTCHLSLAARIDGFRLDDLDAALYRERTLVRLRCMRQSAYVQPVEALPAVVGATGVRVEAEFARLVRGCGLDEDAYRALAERVEAAVAGSPATVPEIRARVGEVPGRREALQFTVARMCAQGRLVRATVRGTWTSDAYTYARWSEWLGRELVPLEPERARTELARRYFRAYGPATAADLQWWAGTGRREAEAAIAALGDALAPVIVEDPQAFVLAEDVEAVVAPGDARGVRLLPVWDPWTMGWKDRRRFLADTDRDRVYDAAGNATSVVVADGRVVGVWELEPGEPLAIRVAPFARDLDERWSEVEEAAERVRHAVGATAVHVERAPAPGRLADGARNAYLAPLRLGRAV